MDAKKDNIEPVIAELLALYREKFANELFEVILVRLDLERKFEFFKAA